MAAAHVRPATLDDLPRLTALWQEKMNLIAQRGRPEADWTLNAAHWLEEPCLLLVAEAENAVIGYVRGQISQDEASTAVIDELVLDLHAYHPSAARTLVDGLRQWADAHAVKAMRIHTLRRMAVEEAFWRSVGAMPEASGTEWLWLKL